MRLLHLTRDFPPAGAGGVSSAVGGLVAALRRAGVACAVASFDGWRPRARGTAPQATEPLPAGGPAAAPVLRISAGDPGPALAALAADFEPDVIHIHDPLLWDAARALPGDLPRVYSVHVHQAALNRLRGIAATASSRAEGEALARADAITAPSAAVAQALFADHPALGPRLWRASWGVAEKKRQPRPADPPELLYAGRFGDVKGTAELSRVIARLLTSQARLRFVVAGGLPHNRRAEARWRERLAAALGPEQRERLELCGWLGEAALAARYRQAFALLFPSRLETFGLVLLEAMSWSLPVVAWSSGAAAELIAPGRSGLLLEPGDEDGLVAGCARLLADPDLARNMGREAAAAVDRDWLWSRRRGEWSAVYEALR